jgi:hypothetical protein
MLCLFWGDGKLVWLEKSRMELNSAVDLYGQWLQSERVSRKILSALWQLGSV